MRTCTSEQMLSLAASFTVDVIFWEDAQTQQFIGKRPDGIDIPNAQVACTDRILSGPRTRLCRDARLWLYSTISSLIEVMATVKNESRAQLFGGIPTTDEISKGAFGASYYLTEPIHT